MTDIPKRGGEVGKWAGLHFMELNPGPRTFQGAIATDFLFLFFLKTVFVARYGDTGLSTLMRKRQADL